MRPVELEAELTLQDEEAFQAITDAAVHIVQNRLHIWLSENTLSAFLLSAVQIRHVYPLQMKFPCRNVVPTTTLSLLALCAHHCLMRRLVREGCWFCSYSSRYVSEPSEIKTRTSRAYLGRYMSRLLLGFRKLICTSCSRDLTVKNKKSRRRQKNIRKRRR